ncbi:MAG: ribonuclease III [Pacificimonas sp.]|jgi:ribonuclease-3|nr:ribonuclease III [Pacificimonas sp.]
MSADSEELRWARTVLGHEFAEPALLAAALTHSSAAARGGRSYERLEFLGDRVLGLVIAEYLTRTLDEPEGSMNRRFSTLVDKQSCAVIARDLGVPKLVRLDESARQARVNHSDNLLGDVCEALIGAIFVDADYKAARTFVLSAWAKRLSASEEGAPPINPKNALQEWAQQRGLPIPTYRLARRQGPEHAPDFEMGVTVGDYAEILGSGSSKQAAEKAAAAAFLARKDDMDMDTER